MTGSFRPDLVLLSPRLSPEDGVQVTNNILRVFPKTDIWVIAIHEEEDGVADRLQAGAKELLLKETPEEKVMERIFGLYS